MELRHLEAFAAVAETSNFTTAAARLHLTQQSLSRLVAQLERELGVRLFERTTRSVRLTAAGAAMVEPARRARDAVADAATAARTAEPRPTRLRIDVSSSGLDTGSRLVRALRAGHPGVAVQEVEVGVADGCERLRSGELDLVFGQATEPAEDLHEEVVRLEPVVLGMARGHRLAALPAVPVRELAGEALLLPSMQAAGEWVRFVHAFCRQVGVSPRPWPGVTHGSTAAADVVATGACVVPSCAWSRVPDDVVFRPLVDPAPVFEWSLFARVGDDGVGPFVATVRALARDAGWVDG